ACAGAAPAPDGPLDCWPPRRHLRPVAAPPPAWPWPHRFPRTQTSASLLNWTGEHSCWPTLVQCELLTRSTVRAWQEVGVRAPWLLHVLHGTPACRRPALRSRLHPRAKRRHKRLQPRPVVPDTARSRLKPLLEGRTGAGVVDEFEREGVAGVGLAALSRHLAPLPPVPVGEERIGVRDHGIDMGQAQRIRARQGQGVDLGP